MTELLTTQQWVLLDGAVVLVVFAVACVLGVVLGILMTRCFPALSVPYAGMYAGHRRASYEHALPMTRQDMVGTLHRKQASHYHGQMAYGSGSAPYAATPQSTNRVVSQRTAYD